MARFPRRVPTEHQVEVERRALQLRQRGETYDTIATQVGYTNRSAARKAVERALTRVNAEDVDQLRELEGTRLDALLNAVWGMAMIGSPEHVDKALKIIALRAKLFGLEVPVKLEHTGPDGAALTVEVIPAVLPDLSTGHNVVQLEAVRT